MPDREPTAPPPAPEEPGTPSYSADDLFAEPADDQTTIVSVPFELNTSYNGRDDILESLSEAYLSFVARGQLSFHLVIGEPGMGKSHTIAELRSWLTENHSDARFLIGKSDDAAVPFAAVSRLLFQRFGIRRGDDSPECRDKIIAGVAEVLPASRVTEVAHLIAQLCRVPFPDSPVVGPLVSTPQRLETRTFLALRRFFAADALEAPIVLCIDNLDGCGPETSNLVQYLAAGLLESPVLLLCTAQSALFEEHPSFGSGEVPANRLELDPLSEQESEILIRTLCEQLDALPEKVVECARALGGSPRAVIELVRLLIESETIVRSGQMSWQVDTELLDTVNLPKTHPDLVAERLRVMAGVEAEIVECASVIGETFWLDSVVSLLRLKNSSTADPDGPTLSEISAAGDHTRLLVAQTLRSLVEREWITVVKDSRLPGEKEYRFSYPYLWEVVYEGIEDEQRRAHHRSAGLWLQMRPAVQRFYLVQEIAEHLEIAKDRLGAAKYYRQAADQARRVHNNPKAKRLYNRALRCIGRADLAERIELWHDLGSLYELTGEVDSALGAFERMLRLSWCSASRTKAAVAFNKMGRVWRRRGDLALALEYLERGQELFEQARDDAGIAGSLDDTGQVLHLLGRYDQAFARITAALQRRGKRGDQRSIAHSLSNLGKIQQDRGRLTEAENCHRDALTIRQDIGDRAGVITSLNNLAVLACERGETAQARSGWQKALSEAEEIGALPLQALALVNLGELALIECHWDEARRRLEDGIALAQEIADPLTEGEATRNLALVEYRHGDPEKARELAAQAYAISKQASLRDNQARALLTLGEIHAGALFDTTSDDKDGPSAVDHFEDGISLFREMGNDVELAKGLELLGRHLIEMGKPGRALLEEAHKLYERLAMKQAATVADLLARL